MKVIIVTVTLLCTYYLLASFNLWWPLNGLKREELGQFGDSWGFITSIFSVCAFVGVAWSVKIQRDSFEQIKEESKINNEMVKRQQFEGAFFQMINLLQSIINDMDVKYVDSAFKEQERKGRDVFLYFYNGFRRANVTKKEFKIKSKALDSMGVFLLSEHLKWCFDQYYIDRQQDLGHYFRVLYNTYKYLDASEISMSDKKRFSNILRAQLSNYELLLIYYNCLGSHGDKFKKIAIDYALFDNMPINKLIHSDHRFVIDKRAFGSQNIN
ncbi:hypothetical protein D3C73_643680 [compost metagenome]